MTSLEALKEQFALLLTKPLDHEHKDAVEAAFKGIEALISKGHDEKVEQQIADALAPLLISLLPGGPTVHTVAALFEPHIGEVVSWLGKELAPMKVTDNQQGKVVHDSGDDAPVV